MLTDRHRKHVLTPGSLPRSYFVDPQSIRNLFETSNWWLSGIIKKNIEFNQNLSPKKLPA